jgi:hypothetical protein
MNGLHRITILAGGVLVAVAATGCNTSTSKSAASGPATSSANVSSTPGAATTAPSAAPSTAASGTTAPAGGTSTGTASAPSTTAPNGGSTTAPNGGSTTAPAPAACDNAKLNASLAPAGPEQKASVYVIAVKNVGPTCKVKPLPYLWITSGPDNNPQQTRPLIPEADPTKQLVILSDTTLYAAIDLDPKSASSAVPGYTFLEVTANPTPNTSGKDVQGVKLPAPAQVSSAMLSMYANNPTSAINQIQYATTPEQ